MMDLMGVEKQLLVGFDYTQGDIPVLVVAEKTDSDLSIINAFKSNDAIELYTLLTTPNKE